MAGFRRRQTVALRRLGIEAKAEKLSGEAVLAAQVSAGSENIVPRWPTTEMSRSRIKSAAMMR